MAEHRTARLGVSVASLMLAAAGPVAPRLPLDEAVWDDAAAPDPPSLPYKVDLEKPDPERLVTLAERLVLTGRFDEARPVLDSLALVPEMSLQSRFMEGYVALQKADYGSAEAELRRAVELNPDFTRARAEWGRALMGLGRHKEADEQFRIAERDRSLPDDVQDLIRTSRRITADKALWSLSVDTAALADSNVNDGTHHREVTLYRPSGPQRVPVHPSERRVSSFGFGAALRAGLRLRAGDKVAVAIETEASANEYASGRGDEASAIVAVGPEFTFDEGGAAVQLFAFGRWYEHDLSRRGFGLRARYQTLLAPKSRLYLYADARLQESGFGRSLDGWQASALAQYERSLKPSLSMSLTAVLRREDLRADLSSNTELSGYYGINAFLSPALRLRLTLGATYTVFDAANPVLGEDPRQDWRLSSGLFLGTRKPQLLGLWPSLNYNYVAALSLIRLHDSERHRLRLNLRKEF